ncbi:MAG: PKD domain-containing protein [Thermoplasmata archaeon]|nr:PKD domain-containing protein [Thermoplasmata archaeon]
MIAPSASTAFSVGASFHGIETTRGESSSSPDQAGLVQPLVESLPIAEAAGEVAFTLAPWDNFTTPGYAKLISAPEQFGPATYDPITGELWISSSNPGYTNPAVRAPLLLLDAANLAARGMDLNISESNGAVYDADNGAMYVIDPDNGSLWVASGTTGGLLHPNILIGGYPNGITFDPTTNEVYVIGTDDEGENITAVNPTTDTVIGSSYLGGSLEGIAYDAPAGALAVTNESGGNLLWISPVTLAINGSSPVGANPEGVTIDASGDAWVANGGAGNVTEVAPNGNTGIASVFLDTTVDYVAADWASGTIVASEPYEDQVQTINGTMATIASATPTGLGPGPLVDVPGSGTVEVMDQDNYFPFVANNLYDSLSRTGDAVTAVDPATGGSLGQSTPLAGAPSSVAFDPATRTAFVGDDYTGSINFVNADTLQAASPWNATVNGTVGGMAYDPVTQQLWVPQPLSYYSNNPSTSLFVGSSLHVLNAVTGAVVRTIYTPPFENSEPFDALYDAANNEVYAGVLNDSNGYGFVQAYDATTFAPAGPGPVTVSEGYPTLALDTADGLLFVASSDSNRVTVINTTADDVVQTTAFVDGDASGIAYDSADQMVYVSDSDTGSLTLLSGATGNVVILQVDLNGGSPSSIAYDPDTQLIYVAVQRNEGNFPFDLETSLVIFNGSSVRAVWGSWPVIYTGFDTPDPDIPTVTYVPSSAAGTPGQIWNVNPGDGSVTVISVAPLVLSFSARQSTLEQGATLNLTATVAGGTNGLSYAYTGLPTGCSTSDALAISCLPTVTGTFPVTFTVTDGFGLSANETLVLTIDPPLSAIGMLAPSVLDVGQSIAASVTPSGGTPPYTVAWSFGDGSTGTGLAVTHTYTSAGSFTVIANVTDQLGFVRAYASTVVVNPTGTPTSLTASLVLGANHTTPGLAVTLTAVAGGVGPYTYSWWLNGSSVSTTTATESYTPAGSGDYWFQVEVSNSNGAHLNRTVELQVVPPLTPSTSTSSPSNGGISEAEYASAGILLGLILGLVIGILVSRGRQKGPSPPPPPGGAPGSTAEAGVSTGGPNPPPGGAT